MPGEMGAWLLLGIAIGLEVVGTTLLKLSDGFAKWHWGVLSIACYALCFWVFAPALRLIPVGVAYAVWSGAGIVAVTAIGYLAFGERLAAAQIFFMLVLLAGLVGLRFTTPG
jgi:multidrug transporter EmrE-like cation transporter